MLFPLWSEGIIFAAGGGNAGVCQYAAAGYPSGCFLRLLYRPWVGICAQRSGLLGSWVCMGGWVGGRSGGEGRGGGGAHGGGAGGGVGQEEGLAHPGVPKDNKQPAAGAPSGPLRAEEKKQRGNSQGSVGIVRALNDVTDGVQMDPSLGSQKGSHASLGNTSLQRGNFTGGNPRRIVRCFPP